MNAFQVFVLFILPLLILAIGVGGAWLHVRSFDRERAREKLHPGE